MGTKTISIMDDVYGLLVDNKLEDESFSDELRRVLTEKKTKKLGDFFGVLSDKEGKEILENLKKKHKANLELKKKRLKQFS